MRRTSVVVAFGVTLAVVFLVTRPEPAAVLPLPAAGEVAAEWLDDGTPVFVTHHAEGDVSVLRAEHPYSRLDAAVAWCPSARRFIGVFTGSRFDRRGKWLGGPSPVGLERYDAEVSDGRLVVGGSRGAPSRRDRGDAGLTDSDQDCWTKGLPGDIDHAAVLVHGEPWADALSPSALAGTRRSGRFHVRGVILESPDAVELCDELAGSKPPRCAGRTLRHRVPGSRTDQWFAMAGVARVELRDGQVTDVTLVAFEGDLGWYEPAREPRHPGLGDPTTPVPEDRVLTIPALDLDFPGPTMTLPRGPWTFRLDNHGDVPHSLFMEGQPQLRLEAQPGERAVSAPLEFAPGTFTLYCAIPGHRQAGMEFTLVIG